MLSGKRNGYQVTNRKGVAIKSNGLLKEEAKALQAEKRAEAKALREAVRKVKAEFRTKKAVIRDEMKAVSQACASNRNNVKDKYEALYQEHPAFRPKPKQKPIISPPKELRKCPPGYNYCVGTAITYPNGRLKYVSWNYKEKPKPKKEKGVADGYLSNGCGCNLY